MKHRQSIKSLHTFTVALAAMLTCSGPAGCTPQVVFNSRVFEKAPIESLLVLTHLEIFDHETYYGFQEGLTRVLATCGVKSKILRIGPFGRGERAPPGTLPWAALSIVGRGGKVRLTSDLGLGDLDFGLELFDPKSNKAFWRADGKLTAKASSHHVHDKDAAVRFATDIVSQLRTDGMLTSCPPGKLAIPKVGASPECLAARRRALVEAMQLENKRERMKAINDAPICYGHVDWRWWSN